LAPNQDKERFTMGNFIRITPFMHIDDVPAAVSFFTDILGFKAWINTPGYAYVQREVAAVRILNASQTEGERVPPGNRRFMYYIDVEDLDAVLTELKPKLDTLPEGHVRGPQDQPYGQRELMIVAPDGNLVVFGQSSRCRYREQRQVATLRVPPPPRT
jgi:catechol 2,3-dioxygenase-like lactoylglutathione lyase family enzyme